MPSTCLFFYAILAAILFELPGTTLVTAAISEPGANLVTKSSYYLDPSRSIPVLPSNSGLPVPTAALKFVTVGRGVQNYTCAGAGHSPVAIGAVAVLYDLSRLARKNESALHEVPSTIVYQPIPDNEIYIRHHGDFPIIGKHFFVANATPVFDLYTKGDILFGKKIASIPAPADADPGPAKTGAVPWLAISSIGGSLGLSEVYRVVTAGGSAPIICTNASLVSIQYAAEYWFFG